MRKEKTIEAQTPSAPPLANEAGGSGTTGRATSATNYQYQVLTEKPLTEKPRQIQAPSAPGRESVNEIVSEVQTGSKPIDSLNEPLMTEKPQQLQTPLAPAGVPTSEITNDVQDKSLGSSMAEISKVEKPLQSQTSSTPEVMDLNKDKGDVQVTAVEDIHAGSIVTEDTQSLSKTQTLSDGSDLNAVMKTSHSDNASDIVTSNGKDLEGTNSVASNQGSNDKAH